MHTRIGTGMTLFAVFALFACGNSTAASNGNNSSGGVVAVGGSSNADSTDLGGNPSGGVAAIGGDSASGGQVTTDADTPACGSTPGEAGFVEIGASDPGIRYVGRFDMTEVDAPRMAFPAATIETQFEGDAIDLRLLETAAGDITTTAYYDVTIDSGAPTKLMTSVGQEVYPLARNLSSGTHKLRISKRTE